MLRALWSGRRQMLGAFAYWTGAGRAFEIVTRPAGAIVLMYHSVSGDENAGYIDPPNRISPELFERQMAYLSTHRRVISFSDLTEQIVSGSTPPAGTVCITFDDGYLDNLSVAAPILARYRLPATLFLATGYVERGETHWADVLHQVFQHNAKARTTMRATLHSRLLEATPSERKRMLAAMTQQLPASTNAPQITMSWSDVRTLCARYPLFEIGGHTREHVDLRTHAGELARAEIDGCAEDIGRELGFRPRHFSFPYGRWCEETREMVSKSGWRSAIGLGTGLRIGRTSDRFAIPRVDTPRSLTALRFTTSGAYPGVFSAIGLT